MFCVKCGSKLKEGAAFCSQCGTRVSVEEGTPNTLEQAEKVNSPVSNTGEAANSNHPNNSNNSNKKVLQAILIAVAVLVVILGCAALTYWVIWPRLHGEASKETQATESEETNTHSQETESMSQEETETVEQPKMTAEEYISMRNVLKWAEWNGYLEKTGTESWNTNYFIEGVPEGEVYLAAYPYDFDQDGENEVLLVGWDDQRRIELTMVTFADGEANESSTYHTNLTISECLSMGDTCDQQDIYLFSDQNGMTCLGLESAGCESIRGDGVCLNFEAFCYKNGAFQSLGTAEYSGSDGENNGMTEELEKAFGIKANWRDLFGLKHRISDYVSDYQDIVCVTTDGLLQSNTDYEKYFAWSESGKDNFLISKIRVWQQPEKKQLNASDYDYASAYIDYIREAEKREDYEKPEGYTLLYISWEDAPLLYVRGSSYAAGDQVISFKDGKISELYASNYGVTYNSETQRFADRGGHMDEYYDTIYTMEDGEVKVIASGNYGAEDNSNVQFDEQGDPIYQYYWNDQSVSKEEYESELKKVYDPDKATEIYPESAEEVIKELEDYHK